MAADDPFIIPSPALLFFIAIPCHSTFCGSFSFDRRSSQEVDAPSQQPHYATAYSPYRPSTAVIIAILALFLSITFLLFLYAKGRANGGDGNGVVGNYFGGESTGVSQGTNFPVCMRKNSGVDRLLVESLPVFRLSSLRGQKGGLECAVCLNRFEPVEVLRLLPKCKHAFHVECVDTWLDAHSTCPLCRYRVDPEDLLLVIEPLNAGDPVRHVEEQRRSSERKSSADSTRKPFVEEIRRISAWHSYTGGRGVLREETAAAAGWFKRQYRKDGLLMTRSRGDRKLEHRIIISDKMGPGCRWSDVQPSDLLYLGSEMVTIERCGKSLPEMTAQKMATAAMIGEASD